MNKNKFLILALITLNACSSSSDWSQGDVPPTPDAGPAENVKYLTRCDVAYPLITNACDWNIRCGFIDDDQFDECFNLYANIGLLWGCQTPVTMQDDVYDACLSSFETLECVKNAYPDECVDIFG